MEVTVRIYTPLDKHLEIVSFQTGIPKSSLILYAVNHYLRSGYSIEELDYIGVDGKPTETKRFTLRMPEHLKQLIDTAAKKAGVSLNGLINQCVYHLSITSWSGYSKIEKITK